MAGVLRYDQRLCPLGLPLGPSEAQGAAPSTTAACWVKKFFV